MQQKQHVIGGLSPVLAGAWFLAFANDPQLGAVATPHGPVTYVQAIVVSVQTVEAMKQDEEQGRGDAELERLRQRNPLLVSARP